MCEVLDLTDTTNFGTIQLTWCYVYANCSQDFANMFKERNSEFLKANKCAHHYNVENNMFYFKTIKKNKDQTEGYRVNSKFFELFKRSNDNNASIICIKSNDINECWKKENGDPYRNPFLYIELDEEASTNGCFVFHARSFTCEKVHRHLINLACEKCKPMNVLSIELVESNERYNDAFFVKANKESVTNEMNFAKAVTNISKINSVVKTFSKENPVERKPVDAPNGVASLTPNGVVSLTPNRVASLTFNGVASLTPNRVASLTPVVEKPTTNVSSIKEKPVESKQIANKQPVKSVEPIEEKVLNIRKGICSYTSCFAVSNTDIPNGFTLTYKNGQLTITTPELNINEEMIIKTLSNCFEKPKPIASVAMELSKKKPASPTEHWCDGAEEDSEYAPTDNGK